MKDEEVQKTLKQACAMLEELTGSYCFDEKAIATLASGILITQALEKINNND